MYIRSLVLALLLPLGTSYEFFQELIPNGGNIPFPCKPGKSWHGVGHINDEGTGPRNPFGVDFENAGYNWTKELCLKDSDGDGFYNGVELGDPSCSWEPNKTVETEGLSHPGICDPWDMARCINKDISSDYHKYNTQGEWMTDVCQSDGLDCPALNEPGMLNLTMRLPAGTPVPADTTSYICATFNMYDFDAPKNKDFHIVAVTPVIDNKHVVHHIALFGCKGYIAAKREPYMCNIVPSPSCQEFLHVWTVGLDGECYYPESGVKIGKNGVQVMVLQYHWTNIGKRTDLTDSSGLTIHFTPNMRKNDASVFLVGPTYFEIDADNKHAVVSGNCASGCTRTLIKHSINVTSAWNHMHLLGVEMMIEVLRNGIHVAYITKDRVYSYDSPQIYTHKQPLELFPGDSIVTTCVFNTKGIKVTTDWGDGTLDEMCFGFITYYPRKNLTSPMCLEIMGSSNCDYKGLEGCSSLRDFIRNIESTRAFKDIIYSCTNLSRCEPQCASKVLKHMRMEACMRGNIWRYIQKELQSASGKGLEFLRHIAPCKAEAEKALKNDPEMRKPK